MRRALWLLAGALVLGAAPASAVDLTGTWYVLIHYRDDASPAPEKWRWEDRIWEFERKGSRLRWVEYPIVVFKDQSGRFARRRGQYARVVHAWEPSPAQLAEIQQGLAVNSRGSKTKTLRGSDRKGWRSAGGPTAASASVVSYSETWSIEGLPDLPVFVREDSLSSGRLEGMSGRTIYRTEEVRENGNLLVGSYERDGTRHGRFRMMRAGPVVGVGSRSQSERQREALIQTLESSAGMRQVVEQELASALAENGVLLPQAELDALVEEAVEGVAQGLSEAEIARRIEKRARERFFAFARPGARHDDGVRYRLPFESPSPQPLLRGVGPESGGSSPEADWVEHRGRFRFGFDFGLPEGTPVVAARAGEVVRVTDGFREGGERRELTHRTNSILVLHDDGSFAVYSHLAPGIEVKPGQRVARGQRLGRSGSTGYTREPKLHFAVLRLDDAGAPESLAIRFDDGSAEGFVPEPGKAYAATAGSRAEAPAPAQAP